MYWDLKILNVGLHGHRKMLNLEPTDSPVLENYQGNIPLLIRGTNLARRGSVVDLNHLLDVHGDNIVQVGRGNFLCKARWFMSKLTVPYRPVGENDAPFSSEVGVERDVPISSEVGEREDAPISSQGIEQRVTLGVSDYVRSNLTWIGLLSFGLILSWCGGMMHGSYLTADRSNPFESCLSYCVYVTREITCFYKKHCLPQWMKE